MFSEDELDPTEREFLDGHDYEDPGQTSVLRTPLRCDGDGDGDGDGGDYVIMKVLTRKLPWYRSLLCWQQARLMSALLLHYPVTY